MLYSLLMYKPKKDTLPLYYVNRKTPKSSSWFYTRTPMGYQIITYLHKYAVVFLPIMVLIVYTWFTLIANYVNTIQYNMLLLAYSVPLAVIVFFHGKYRETNDCTVIKCVQKTLALKGIGLCIGACIVFIDQIGCKGSFMKYFILEESVVYTGIILHSIDYSNKTAFNRFLTGATVLYSLKTQMVLST